MTVKTYEVGLKHMPVGRDVFDYNLVVQHDGEIKRYSGLTPAYEFGQGHHAGELYPLNQAAIDVVKEHIDKSAVIHGTRVTYTNLNLNFYAVEVDMEFPSALSLVEQAEEEERVEWANEVAIKLISGMGYGPDDEDGLGDAVEAEGQAVMIQAVLRFPALENVAEVMEAVKKYGCYMKPELYKEIGRIAEKQARGE